MGRRRRAVSSGRLEAWLRLRLVQGELVMLPSRLMGGTRGPSVAGHHGRALSRRRPWRSESVGGLGKEGGVEMPCAGLRARECRVAGLYPGQDRRRGQATALPRRSACGREQKGGGEEAEAVPPVTRESREGGVDLLRKEVFQGVFCK
jgi:hypothetical protein